MSNAKNKIALVLSGGGARAAYQVGVLKAVAEILPKGASNPFPVISGTSAGAINSAALAIYGANFNTAVRNLLRIWQNFHVDHVFRADAAGIFRSGFHWLGSLFLGGLGKRNPVSFLDRSPLYALLQKHMPCEKIQQALDQGVVESLAITASAYGAGQSVTFYHSSQHIVPWSRWRRVGRPDKISIDHLMASSSIPFIFSAVQLGNDYYGDGSIRQSAPASPALHLGANKIMIIGMSQYKYKKYDDTNVPAYPSFAQIGGHILNSIFSDSMDADIERLNRINKTIDLIPSHQLTEHNIHLRPIETLVLAPSQDVQEIAAKHTGSLPWLIRFFLKGVGALDKSGSSLVSYLLFEKSFCQEMIDLGYNDAMEVRESIEKFLELKPDMK